MDKIFLSFVLCISFYLSTCSKSLITPFIREGNSYSKILIFYDSDTYTRITKFDMGHEYSLFELNNFTIKDNLYYGNNSFWLYDRRYNATRTKAKLQDKEGTFQLDDFFANVIRRNEEKDVTNKGIIGVSFKFSDEKYSLIHQLKNQGFIDHLSFAFSAIGFQNNGQMFFGSIPESYISNMNKNVIKVDQSRKGWGVPLDSIEFTIDDKTYQYENKYYAHFNAYEDRIFVPDDFFMYLNDIAFKKYYNNGACHLTADTRRKYINCNITMIKDFPEIKFNIGGIKIMLNYQKLFGLLSRKNSYFIIQVNSFDEDNKDTFLFGSFLFDQFITEFDYEEKTVNLYSQIVLETYSNNTMKKSLLIVIDIIMISCVAGLIYAVKKRKAPKMIVNDFI